MDAPRRPTARPGGGLVLADVVAGGDVTWPAVAMVIAGIVATIAGLAILTARRPEPAQEPDVPLQPRGDEHDAGESEAGPPEHPAPAPPRPASPGPPVSRASSRPEPRPVSDTSATSHEQAPATPTGEGEAVPAMHSQGPCDWELRVDVAGGAPTVVRRAEGTACCVHVLRLRSLDSAPVPSEHEDRSWSGDRTRIGPSRAVSDVWADSRRVRPSVRGLDLDLEATLTRTARPPVVTTVDDVEVGPRLLPEAERLWTAHLARLREANVTSDPDEVPTRLQTATRHRTSVVLDTTHGCDAPAHHIDATGEASVRVEGEVAPVGGTRLSLPTVATWIEGDLDVAATHPMEVSRDTHVHAAPGASALSGLSLETAPGSGVVRGVFTGRGETHLVGGGIELQVACAVVADLGLGDDPGHHAAEAHVATALAHRLRLVVSSHAHHPRGDAGAGTDLGCTCAPAYEVQFGIDPDGAAPTAPHARLHVDGRAFGLTAVSMPGTGDVPVWTVQAETGTDLPRGTTG